MGARLRISAGQYDILCAHLLPGDGLEAAPVMLCGRRADHDGPILLCRDILCVPHKERQREPDRLKWQITSIVDPLVRAAKDNLSVIKIHSHPGNLDGFSPLDDESDRAFFSSLYAWSSDEVPHGSCIIRSDGRIRVRTVGADGSFRPIETVMIVGDDLKAWHASDDARPTANFALRHAQVFGSETTSTLQSLAVGVVGCSGTGSPVVEQLSRLGVGRLVLVDPDRVERVNLNRILNATEADAQSGALKVDVLARAVGQMGTGTRVKAIPSSICTPEAVHAVAGCDVLFGCVDGVEGRHVMNRLATFYLLPYFDVGVRIDADGRGGVSSIWGSVHYIQPGGSSLLSRGVYSLDDYRADALRREDPLLYGQLRKHKYIKGVQEAQPAVVSINMHLASMAVLELLARIHPYRYEENRHYAVTRVSLSDMSSHNEPEGEPCPLFSRHIGRGDVDPALDMPGLSVTEGIRC